MCCNSTGRMPIPNISIQIIVFLCVKFLAEYYVKLHSFDSGNIISMCVEVKVN